MSSRVAIAAAALFLVLPGAAALAAFPGSDPSESPRVNTPNDPDFDPCEADDETTPAVRECDSYFNEQWGAFGFRPDSAQTAANQPTTYADCSQLDQQGRAANAAAGDPTCAQIGGVRADTAWKHSAGSPAVSVAILDTGIRWQERELVDKVHLNSDELPLPRKATGNCAKDDCNGDGAFNVKDFASDPRVAIAAGDTESDPILDASDLIATFSRASFNAGGKKGGRDDDGNGYVDDIAGWDFFDDDNDPFDASSCCSSVGHGTGRAREALARANNGIADAGMCPRCQLMPLRVWDTFVVDTNRFALATVYAADNGASVVEGAVGGLVNSNFARRAFEYADSKGVALTLVSSDINSADHNYPTNYNEAIYVAGSLPDSAPNENCQFPGIPFVEDFFPPPEFQDQFDQFVQACQSFLTSFTAESGIPVSSQPTTTSFFRNSNLTQYGGKADIVMVGSTGSENTGQASGAAGLLASFGRQTFGADDPLSGNEIRQLLTMTAEDVLPQNTGSIGLPDKANAGWDPHFGYGRVNLAGAMARIAADRVPPEAQLDAPDWFAPIDLARVGAGGVRVKGRAANPHGAGVGSWQLAYACGQDAPDSTFQPVPGANGSGAVDGSIGTLSKSLLQSLADSCDGSVSNDAGSPAGGAGSAWPADPYPSPDPQRHAFQIRLTVREKGDASNRGRYRKTLFAYNDDGNLAGWPKPVGAGSVPADLVTGSGGEVPPRLFDLDGDNALDVLLPTSSGELYALKANGAPVQSWNGGEPVRTRVYEIAQDHPAPAGSLGDPPRESLRAPVIGDIDGDLEPEVVATAGEHVYAWHSDGTRATGFPRRIDPALSEPCKPNVPKPCFNAVDRVITTVGPGPENHIKRGFIGSPALADLDGDGRLDIVAGSLDQHLYAWKGTGAPLPGFPRKLSDPDAVAGAEIVTSPAIADLDGNGDPEVVIATNEAIGREFGTPPDNPFDLFNVFLQNSTGASVLYAVNGDGSAVPGWPIRIGNLISDILPLVGPGHDAAVFDETGDGDDELSVSALTADAKLVNGDGQTIRVYQNGPGNLYDQSRVLNVYDYSSIGDVLGGGQPSVFKAGLSLNGAANLFAVNQNLPFNHVIQGWIPQTGAPLPGFPRATDDYQLLSQPAIAKVDSSGPTRQALFGTGLYQLHAYGAGGVEPAGWPKFAGGWLQVTPSIGDANGDGKLDVAAVTREGWSFLWGTDAPACQAGSTSTNQEWWTFHHDEHGTANYGHDARPPGAPRQLAASRAGATVNLAWKAPGDDWLCGQASRLRIVASDAPIQHPSDGTLLDGRATSQPAGGAEAASFSDAQLGNARHVAVLYRDSAGNWGHLTSVALPQPPHCVTQIRGDAGPNTLIGTDSSDVMLGFAGNDFLDGRGADDCLYGGSDDDHALGGGGNDRISGLGGVDVIRGEGGRDTIYGRLGPDRLVGGDGRDTFYAGGGPDVVDSKDGVPETVDCGARRDIARVDRSDTLISCEMVTYPG